ncbi:hypothetical protein [Streptomyces viridosporus]|uniref:hypothetical protein n=1 Tax=Streptomyces viridosporus TaxID=67581 RepID=UPI00117F7DA5|nr:hypothetical protein [Streptomyces viridosporus]
MPLKGFLIWERSCSDFFRRSPVRFSRHRVRTWTVAVLVAVVSLVVAALLPHPSTADSLVPVARAEPGAEDDCAVPGTGPRE